MNREWELVPTAADLEQQRVERHPESHAEDVAAADDDGADEPMEWDGRRCWRAGPEDEAARGYSLILPQPGSPPPMTKKKKKRWKTVRRRRVADF